MLEERTGGPVPFRRLAPVAVPRRGAEQTNAVVSWPWARGCAPLRPSKPGLGLDEVRGSWLPHSIRV